MTCQHGPTEIEATDAEVKDLDALAKLTFIRINFGCSHAERPRLSLRDFLFPSSIRPFVIHSSSQHKREKKQVGFFWSRVDP